MYFFCSSPSAVQATNLKIPVAALDNGLSLLPFYVPVAHFMGDEPKLFSFPPPLAPSPPPPPPPPLD
jgi:hypothetical protein